MPCRIFVNPGCVLFSNHIECHKGCGPHPAYGGHNDQSTKTLYPRSPDLRSGHRDRRPRRMPVLRPLPHYRQQNRDCTIQCPCRTGKAAHPLQRNASARTATDLVRRMRYRVDFVRRTDPATRAGQSGMRWSVEVIAKTKAEAIEIAQQEAASVGKHRMYQINQVRKI